MGAAGGDGRTLQGLQHHSKVGKCPEVAIAAGPTFGDRWLVERDL